jgi:hypothetical protein
MVSDLETDWARPDESGQVEATLYVESQRVYPNVNTSFPTESLNEN